MEADRLIWGVTTVVKVNDGGPIREGQWMWRDVVRFQISFSDKLGVGCERNRRGQGNQMFSLNN